MKSIYNVEYKYNKTSVWHWECGVEALNREQAKNLTKMSHGYNVVIGQVHFVQMVPRLGEGAETRNSAYGKQGF